jgi:hypothetical protein
MFTLFVSLLTRALCLRALLTCAHDVYIQKTYTSFGAAQRRPESLKLGTEQRILLYNLAQRSPHRKQQQHDRREQQQKDQEWRRFLLSDNDDYDREDIIISIDDDVSAMMSSPTTSSLTLREGTRSNDHNQENPTPMKQQKEEEKKKDRKVRVVSFRLSERDYERHLSMAKLCYENGLTKGPDIVSYICLSMECLWQYINSQGRGELSAEKTNRQQPQPQRR